jgi:hypothetical protein
VLLRRILKKDSLESIGARLWRKDFSGGLESELGSGFDYSDVN